MNAINDSETNDLVNNIKFRYINEILNGNYKLINNITSATVDTFINHVKEMKEDERLDLITNIIDNRDNIIEGNLKVILLNFKSELEKISSMS